MCLAFVWKGGAHVTSMHVIQSVYVAYNYLTSLGTYTPLGDAGPLLTDVSPLVLLLPQHDRRNVGSPMMRILMILLRMLVMKMKMMMMMLMTACRTFAQVFAGPAQ